MSETGVAVESVGGAKERTDNLVSSHLPGHYTRHFSRTYVHYVDSNVNAVGFKRLPKGDMDEGWQIFPYRSLRASMGPRDMYAFSEASAFKVDKMGFSATGFQPMVDELSAISGTPVVKTTYNSNPQLLVMKDKNRVLEQIIFNPAKPDDEKKDFLTNNLMRNSWPISKQEGTLPRANFRFGPDFSASIVNEDHTEWSVYSSLNEGDISSYGVGQNFGHEWDGSSHGRWYPVGKVPTLENPAQFKLTSLPYGSIEYNLASQVNEPFKDHPYHVMCRINPVHGTTHPLKQSGYMFVTYYATLTFMRPPSGLRTLNLGLTVLPTGKTDVLETVPVPQFSLAPPRCMSAFNAQFRYTPQITDCVGVAGKDGYSKSKLPLKVYHARCSS